MEEISTAHPAVSQKEEKHHVNGMEAVEKLCSEVPAQLRLHFTVDDFAK